MGWSGSLKTRLALGSQAEVVVVDSQAMLGEGTVGLDFFFEATLIYELMEVFDVAAGTETEENAALG